MRKAVIALAACLALPGTASAAQSAPLEIAPDLQQVGQAEFSYLFWDIFDARLFASGDSFSWQAPFALSLQYRREFSAKELTDKSIEIMGRVTDWSGADLVEFQAVLAPCMASVRDGDRFTAVGPDADTAVLYLNGKERCKLEKPGIRRDYFSIWLSPKSDFPDEARKLLSQ
jgi:hypothetical protein